MNHQDEVELIRQSITYGADAPTAVIERLGTERTFALISAALTLAVERKFPDPVDLESVKAYATDLPRRFPDGEGELKPETAEAVIRAALGELELLDSMSHGDIIGMMFLVTYAIMSHEPFDDDLQAAYINDVIELANE